ncbi:MAG: cytochrome-c oxidase, cbb3-type subunit III [Granulosicoccus sp.]
MSLIERDKHSGYKTTGHEWNGIKELNTPVPRLVILCLVGTILFSVGYWYLMPSWPLVDRFFPGKLDVNERAELINKIAEAKTLKHESWIDQLEETEFEEIIYDQRLMSKVNISGARLFDDNCAMCHGREGVGNLNYPSLADESWLWGDDPAHIEQTLRVGINSQHPESRVAIMPALGESGILDKETIEDIVGYVSVAARLPVPIELTEAKRQQAGMKGYQATCAGCHGQNMQGNQSLGAPNLIDQYWIYGHSPEQIVKSVWSGRQGHMPSWEKRLQPYERKILALFVTTLD